MKIRRIEVRDWMCYEGAAVDLGVLNVVVGRNNAGKSALFRDALQYVLLGRAKGIRRKKDSTALQRDGGKGMRAALFVQQANGEDIFELARIGSGQLALTIPDLEKLMGVPVPAAECMLDCLCFLNMALEERLAVLSSITSSNDSAAQLAVFFAPLMPPEGAKMMCEMAVADRRKALAFAVERRREAKRKLAEQEAVPAPADESMEAAGRKVQLSAVRVDKLVESVAKVKGEVRDLGFAVGAAKLVKDAEALPERLAQIVAEKATQVKAMEDEAGRLRLQLTTLGLAEQGLASAQERFATHADIVRAASVELVKSEAEEARLKREIEAVDGLGGECPTCQQPVSQEHKVEVCRGLVKQAEAARKEQTRLEKVIGKSKRACQDENEEIGAAQAALAERGNLSAAIARNEDSLALYRAGKPDVMCELGRLVQEEKHIAEELAAVKKAEASVGAFEAAEKKLDELSALFDKAAVYAFAKTAFDRAQEFVPKLKQDIEKWDKVAAVLADNGPAAEVTASGWSAERLAQSVGLLLPGRTVTIEADGSVLLDGRPIEVASESERFRVGVAVSDLIAFCGKGRFLVIDGADIVQDDAKLAVSTFVRTVSGDYETVILIATGDPSKAGGDVVAGDEREADVVLLADGKPVVVRWAT